MARILLTLLASQLLIACEETKGDSNDDSDDVEWGAGSTTGAGSGSMGGGSSGTGSSGGGTGGTTSGGSTSGGGEASGGEASGGEASGGEASGGDDGTMDAVPGEACDFGSIFDCALDCVDEDDLGDGSCDDGSYSYDPNFYCTELSYDAGDCDPPVLSCEADLTITEPGIFGESTTIDFCAQSNLTMRYEFDPDDPPEVRSPVITLDAIDTSSDFDCNIVISEPGACGAGYYTVGGYSTTADVDIVTNDCTGVSDAFEGTYAATAGYLRFAILDAGSVPGDLEGVPIDTTVTGYLDVSTTDGLRIAGSFSLRKEISAEDSEEAACSVYDGDDDGDGHVSTAFGGDDCDDSDPYTGPGFASGDDEDACMRDADGDGYGDPDVPDGVTPGSDCDDSMAEMWADCSECVDDDESLAAAFGTFGANCMLFAAAGYCGGGSPFVPFDITEYCCASCASITEETSSGL